MVRKEEVGGGGTEGGADGFLFRVNITIRIIIMIITIKIIEKIRIHSHISFFYI
jgi:hypothetical protein